MLLQILFFYIFVSLFRLNTSKALLLLLRNNKQDGLVARKSIFLPQPQGEQIDFLRSLWGRGKRRKSMGFYA
jgi:hypothetical protein